MGSAWALRAVVRRSACIVGLPVMSLAGILLASCSVKLADVENSEPTRNVCTSSSECGGGRCVDGACFASEARFTTVLFEMNPPVSMGKIAGVRFLQRVDSLPAEGGRLDLAFGHVARVSGWATPLTGVPAGCSYVFRDESGAALDAGADGSIPMRVTFVPLESLLGLPTVDYNLDVGSLTDNKYVFNLRVPPGDYSVYVRPLPGYDATSCAVPPQLYRSLTIDAGDVTLALTLPEPESLALTVRWPDTAHSLDGWSVDMIDPVSGRPLSTRAQLSDAESAIVPDPQGTGANIREYTTAIVYSPVVDVTPSTGKELLRLSPPDGVDAPTLLIERSALELFAKGEGIIDQLTTIPPVIQVKGQVVLAGSTTPAAATLTLVATQTNDVSAGVQASYVRTVDAGEDGTFSVKLLPGQYDVYAVPAADSGLAATRTSLAVSRDNAVQDGKVIELSNAATLSGSVFDPAGREAVTGAQVQAVPASVAQPFVLFDPSLGRVSFTPRASTTNVSDEGRFSVLADPGTFDVSVRPAPETQFAWYVRPNVTIEPPSKDLGSVQLPLPVHYAGTVSSAATGPVPSALIRAYIYMDQTPSYTADPSLARSVLQIAEATSDEQGNFDLYLPSQLN